MQRMVFAALVGLLLAIGLTVGTVAWRTTSFERTMPDVGAADPAAGHAFYAGIDQILAGGGPSALEQAVTGDFVDHAGGGATSRSADELVEQLTALGTSFPGTRIEVTDIQASAGSLVATIAPIAPAPVQVAGMTMTAQPMNGGYEVLRIRNGKVSERWSASLPDISATTFDSSGFSPGMSANVTTRLVRVALPRGAERIWWGESSSLVIVETGAVRIVVESPDSTGAQQDTVTLREGEATRTLPGAKTRIASEGDGTAQVLIYSARPVTPMDIPANVHPGGSRSTLLWASNMTVSLYGRWSVSVGKVALPPDGEVTFYAAPGTEVLFCSDASALQVDAPGGVIESLDTSYTATGLGSSSTIDAGVAADISEAEQISFRTADAAPATIWLITMAPRDSLATPGP